ncbi:hypothetical protein V2O64_18190 [Verrucomicrobiaceae bacterium 227]
MKILLLLVLTTLFASAQVPVWKASTGLPGIFSHPTRADDGSLYFAATSSSYDFVLKKAVYETTLYLSTDNGASFAQQGGSINDTFTNITFFDIVNGELWMAGEAGSGLDWFYHSTDGLKASDDMGVTQTLVLPQGLNSG